ncbi:MAG: 2-hydroxyacid dehydrogenase [Candidatus Saccharimonadales bacterium]
MKAFVFDPLWNTLITDELKAQIASSGLEVIVTTDIAPLSANKELFDGSDERILCINPDYVSWKLSADDYKDIPNLKGIFGSATSFSWIDASYANANNIPICNIRNFSTQAVAEWAITMLFNLARQTPRLIKDGFPLDFDKDFMKYRGIELRGKTAGIVGLGHNGEAIAERLKGLGLNVVYWSKNTRNDNYKYSELEDIFTNADVIIPTFAHNEETDAIITDELLGKTKPSAIVVDIIELENKDKIIEMVKDGKLFGYGFEAKPKSFAEYEGNIWSVPAYAWVTDGSMNNSMTKLVENMVNAVSGNFPNRVNQ